MADNRLRRDISYFFGGAFDLRRARHALVFGAGAALMSVMLVRAFGRFHGGL